LLAACLLAAGGCLRKQKKNFLYGRKFTFLSVGKIFLVDPFLFVFFLIPRTYPSMLLMEKVGGESNE